MLFMVLFIGLRSYTLRYILYSKDPNGGLIGTKSYDMDFLKDDSLRIREVKKYTEFYELENKMDLDP